MKRFATLITILAFMGNLAFGQNSTEPRNSIKFGIGTAFLKPDSYFGKNTLHAQYAHRLFRPVSLSVDGMRINGSQLLEDGNERSTMTYQVDGGLSLALFSNESNAFKIGGGATWQNADNRFTTSVERDSNMQIIDKKWDEETVQEFGWTASLEYEVYVVKHIVLGTRLSYKKYQSGVENYFFGLNAGFRF